ncbi:MAG: NAD(P)H-dependent oxidoreductase subunit E [Firmicutes bacterium]|nr:NAD(P)H-dependent oxidoreductase subunit E [Bacillota bacterium]
MTENNNADGRVAAAPVNAAPVSEAMVEEILQKHREKHDALHMVLQDLHKLAGWVPDNAVYQIAEGLNLAPAVVFDMIAYYPLFKPAPEGKYKISICLGTTCYLRGSARILERCCRELNIEPGHITPDGKFSLEIVRCLGACALSASITINDVVYPRVEPDKIPAILKSLE